MIYLSIGQLERMLSIPASTLRFWEQEVPLLMPSRTKSGRRNYSLSEVVLIARLKHLALDKKLGLGRAQRILEYELLYQDQELRANIKQLREELFRLLLDCDRWKASLGELIAVSTAESSVKENSVEKNLGKESLDGTDDKELNGFC
ncbi:MAG TPA: MerR family transcriptional regulator [Rectinema sp.]|nr:MerR family transcriptional regulator [Rectinema sp.]HOD58999.1 MerR family transcriptional regulator [Rectinema sp.]HPV59388.1 MerR family transcriptional regulator [Rectinema sp.]HQL16124.1 MerR family transcriptional regulator [Rectinema sp.]HQO46280.1 MerR family transcriptional regulator [Rectinema sp.]